MDFKWTYWTGYSIVQTEVFSQTPVAFTLYPNDHFIL